MRSIKITRSLKGCLHCFGIVSIEAVLCNNLEYCDLNCENIDANEDIRWTESNKRKMENPDFDNQSLKDATSGQVISKVKWLFIGCYLLLFFFRLKRVTMDWRGFGRGQFLKRKLGRKNLK